MRLVEKFFYDTTYFSQNVISLFMYLRMN